MAAIVPMNFNPPGFSPSSGLTVVANAPTGVTFPNHMIIVVDIVTFFQLFLYLQFIYRLLLNKERKKNEVLGKYEKFIYTMEYLSLNFCLKFNFIQIQSMNLNFFYIVLKTIER